MQNSPIVSVIVAVYNSEKTLARLLDSLCGQTFQDYEVLMIDDGSTDSSGLICDRYAAKDKRFKAFHKHNEGIGSTRQFGIDHASGVYTIHADSDDWVEPDYLQLFHERALETGADMIISDYYRDRNGRSSYRKQTITATDRDGLVRDMFYNLHGSPCNKLVRRSFYVERGIRYIEGMNYGEDKLFNLQLALSGITVAHLAKASYHYDVSVNPKSATHGFSLTKIQQREDYVMALREILPDSFQTGIDDRNLDVVYMSLMSRAFDKPEFLKRFSFLSRVKWRDYDNKSLSTKRIIWTSLHLSYELALFMCAIKKVRRRLQRKPIDI